MINYPYFPFKSTLDEVVGAVEIRFETKTGSRRFCDQRQLSLFLWEMLQSRYSYVFSVGYYEKGFFHCFHSDGLKVGPEGAKFVCSQDDKHIAAGSESHPAEICEFLDLSVILELGPLVLLKFVRRKRLQWISKYELKKVFREQLFLKLVP